MNLYIPEPLAHWLSRLGEIEAQLSQKYRWIYLILQDYMDTMEGLEPEITISNRRENNL